MFAIHFLSAPVYKAKYSKRNRTRKIRRPKSDRTKKRSKMRVNTGKAFVRWRELRVSKCLKMDAKFALLLLDR